MSGDRLAVAFSDAFIRALKDGSKRSYRRPVDPQPTLCRGCQTCQFACDHFLSPVRPLAAVGSTLWVKECWRVGPMDPERILGTPSTGKSPLIFRADIGRAELAEYDRSMRYRKGMGWCSGMSLPKCHSRWSLLVTDYRVEKLHAISAEEAIGEGMPMEGHRAVQLGFEDDPADWPTSARAAFQKVWDRSMEPRGFGWDTNPYVHVVEFEVVKKP